jgi:hypothetical protein
MPKVDVEGYLNHLKLSSNHHEAWTLII